MTSKTKGNARALREKDEAIQRTLARSLRGEARSDEMERLYREEGWTLERIGLRFAISKERVRQLLLPRGVTGSDRKGSGSQLANLTASQRKQIIELLDAHWPSVDVSKHLRITIKVVQGVWKEHRLRLRAEKIERAKKLYEKYKSAWKVGDIMGVSDQCVLTWLKGTGLIVPLSARGYPKEIRERALKMKRKGILSDRIAEELGCCRETVDIWWRAEQGRPRARTRIDSAPAQLKRRNDARLKRLALKRKRMAKAAAKVAPQLTHVASKARPAHEH